MQPESRPLAASFSFSDPALALGGGKLVGGQHDERDNFEAAVHRVVRESRDRARACARPIAAHLLGILIFGLVGLRVDRDFSWDV
jgi:hypothetical protein